MNMLTYQTLTISFWKYISKEIASYLKNEGIDLHDIYWVGSRLINHTVIENTDFDNVIIIRGAHTLDYLRELRDNVNEFKKLIDLKNLYHFKLFDFREFILMATYDGFRLYEFQLKNYSLNGTDFINSVQPNLNEQCFINSLLIQLVYDSFTNHKPLNNSIFSESKTMQRFIRNIKIVQDIDDSKRVLKNLPNTCKKDKLLQLFTKNNVTNTPNGWLHFLQLYFERFRHEFVNKSSIYYNNIISVHHIVDSKTKPLC